MSYAIEITDLKKMYGNHEVLKGINFCVEHGEIFGILGINGAGKTTILECIEGFRKYHSGNKLYTELSAGQKRRLHLTLALIGKPDILFLDEPTTELDVEGRISLHNEIRKLNQNGTTIILSSHDMAEVEALCTRIAILNNGVISFIGTTDELASKVGKKYNIKIVSELGENEYSAVNVADTLLSILEEYKQKNIDIFDIKVNRGTLEQHFINLSKGV